MPHAVTTDFCLALFVPPSGESGQCLNSVEIAPLQSVSLVRHGGSIHPCMYKNDPKPSAYLLHLITREAAKLCFPSEMSGMLVYSPCILPIQSLHKTYRRGLGDIVPRAPVFDQLH